MTKFNLFIFVFAAIGIITVNAIINSYNYGYEKGYAAGADSLSDSHVNEVCIQWLFQSNLETARRKVCAK